MNDPWKELGVNRTASEDEVKQAYRRLAKQYHPDKPTGNEEKFKRVSEAYDIIKNGGPQQPNNPFHHQQGPNPFQQRNPFEGFEDIFAQQFGDFRRRPPRNNDTKIQVVVSLEEVVTQSTKVLDLKSSFMLFLSSIIILL